MKAIGNLCRPACSQQGSIAKFWKREISELSRKIGGSESDPPHGARQRSLNLSGRRKKAKEDAREGVKLPG